MIAIIGYERHSILLLKTVREKYKFQSTPDVKINQGFGNGKIKMAKWKHWLFLKCFISKFKFGFLTSKTFYSPISYKLHALYKDNYIDFSGRIEAAMYLLSIKAPSAVYDDQGVSCLSIMVQKMPGVAFLALQQFYAEDRANRKLYCYLNYLEKKLLPEEENQISWKYLTKEEREKQKREMSLNEMVTKKQIKKGELAKSVLEVYVQYIVLDNEAKGENVVLQRFLINLPIIFTILCCEIEPGS